MNLIRRGDSMRVTLKFFFGLSLPTSLDSTAEPWSSAQWPTGTTCALENGAPRVVEGMVERVVAVEHDLLEWITVDCEIGFRVVAPASSDSSHSPLRLGEDQFPMPEIDAELLVDQVTMLGLVSREQLREAMAGRRGRIARYGACGCCFARAR